MKRVVALCAVVIAVSSLVVWADEDVRVWSAADGSSTVEAALVEVNGNNVELRKKDGSKATVPVSKLCPADREYIDSYTKENKADEKQPSVAAPAPLDLPYEQGKVVGPIEASSDSHYYLYIPKSLKADREVPLLFYTHSVGGSGYLLNNIVEGAEINGWIMAVSVESKNGRGDGDNNNCSKRAVDHIRKTLPVDMDRLYFTGNSGGAATACINYDSLSGCGLMPNIGYLPGGVSVPSGDCFIINGSNDYNRYASAIFRKSVGKTAVHRFFKGGHNDAPGWLMVEGMTWLEGRFLAKKGARNQAEQLDYENAVLEWIGRLRDKEPYRAYYWARFLQDELKLTAGNKSKVEALVLELGANETNKLYVEALEEIDSLSIKVLSSFGGSAEYDHSDPQITSKCKSMLDNYRKVPIIKELLQALSEKTVSE